MFIIIINMSGCKPKFTKKYLSRPSPNFPAKKCRGQSLTGQDRNMYISKKDNRGIYKWFKLNTSFLNSNKLSNKLSNKSLKKSLKK
jgi:hypothetical protein